MLEDFKKFAMRGNVVDLAVGVIVGGAFDGLDKIIQARVGKKSMGFGADIKSSTENTMGQLLKELQPEDLLKFGLIPEIFKNLDGIKKSDVIYVGYPGHVDVVPAWIIAKIFRKKLVFNS